MLTVRTVPGLSPRFAAFADGVLHVVTLDGDQWRETTITTYSDVSFVEAADLNGDGRMDYLAGGQTFLATADEKYTAVQRTGPNNPFLGGIFSPADVDRDGRLDLVVTTRTSIGDPGYLLVLRNLGDALFEADSMAMTAPTATGTATANSTVADLDGDGWSDVAIGASNGVEVLTNVCVSPRVKVALLTPAPSAGGRVELLIRALSTNSFSVGVIYIEEDGRTLGTRQPYLAWDFATTKWVSPALTAGPHTYTIRYEDQYGGKSETTVSFTARPVPPRRRAAG